MSAQRSIPERATLGHSAAHIVANPMPNLHDCIFLPRVAPEPIALLYGYEFHSFTGLPISGNASGVYIDHGTESTSLSVIGCVMNLS